MTLENGTIDITNVVDNIREDFVTLAETYIKGQAAGVFAIPILSTILSMALHWGLEALSQWSVMQAFFLNTAIRKASQAADYVDAINAKKSLPSTASEDEYEKAEQNQIRAFSNFVRVTN